MIPNDLEFQTVSDLIECSKSYDTFEEEWNDKYFFETISKSSSKMITGPQTFEKQLVCNNMSDSQDTLDLIKLNQTRIADPKFSLRIRKIPRIQKRKVIKNANKQSKNQLRLDASSPKIQNQNTSKHILTKAKKPNDKQNIMQILRTELKPHKVVARVANFYDHYNKSKTTEFTENQLKEIPKSSQFIQKLKPLNQINFVKKSKILSKEFQTKESKAKDRRFNMLNASTQVIKYVGETKQCFYNFASQKQYCSLLDITQKSISKRYALINNIFQNKLDQLIKQQKEAKSFLNDKEKKNDVKSQLYQRNYKMIENKQAINQNLRYGNKPFRESKVQDKFNRGQSLNKFYEVIKIKM